RAQARQADAAATAAAAFAESLDEAVPLRAGVGVAAARTGERRDAAPEPFEPAVPVLPPAFGDLALADDVQLADVEVPADGDEALRLLYLRLQALEARQADLGWDEPPTALGMEQPAGRSLIGSPTNGWMRVRVAR
ncbi:MAG: hypothetical protein R3362_09350, partial [Rhodothermales bacterium]|nr:hypothetical protein [Rhodothermales bacterium]